MGWKVFWVRLWRKIAAWESKEKTCPYFSASKCANSYLELEVLPCQKDAVAKARCCFEKANTGGNVLFWEVGAWKWALWVWQEMLLCAYMPSVSADLLVTRFLFFNLMFWVLCHDVVMHPYQNSVACTGLHSNSFLWAGSTGGLGRRVWRCRVANSVHGAPAPVLRHRSVPQCCRDVSVAPVREHPCHAPAIRLACVFCVH